MEETHQGNVDEERLSIGLGGWLFAQRGVLPIFVFAYPFFFTKGVTKLAGPDILAAVVLVALGEMMRLWSAGHLGGRGRSRHGHVRELVVSGPFRRARNPLYIGNFMQWLGIGLLAGCRWYLLVIIAAFALIYSLIVRWEEQLLTKKIGADYTDYVSAVPRWIPSSSAVGAQGRKWEMKKAFRSERSTLYALASIMGLLLVKFIIVI